MERTSRHIALRVCGPFNSEAAPFVSRLARYPPPGSMRSSLKPLRRAEGLVVYSSLLQRCGVAGGRFQETGTSM